MRNERHQMVLGDELVPWTWVLSFLVVKGKLVLSRILIPSLGIFKTRNSIGWMLILKFAN